MLPKAQIGVKLGMNAPGVGSPLLFHEEHLVIVEAVANPGLGAATDRLVAARYAFTNEKFLSSRTAGPSAAVWVQNLSTLDLESKSSAIRKDDQVKRTYLVNGMLNHIVQHKGLVTFEVLVARSIAAQL